MLGMSMMSMKPLFPAKSRVEVAQPSSKRMWAWGSASSWGKTQKVTKKALVVRETRRDGGWWHGAWLLLTCGASHDGFQFPLVPAK